MKTILMEKREEVIENIERMAKTGDLNAKVEVDDPLLTTEEKRALVKRFLAQYPTLEYRIKNHIARWILNVATRSVNRGTQITGLEKIEGIKTGAIVTSNHFSPIDNTVVRFGMHKAGKWRMPVVGQEANLAMPALFGFMMRYADVIPISNDHHYMTGEFEGIINDELASNNFILIYPEQEMWFNYRKPRPGKRGPYYYAAKFGVPVISCFVEIIDKDDLQTPNFVEVGYHLHILDPIFPNPELSIRENSIQMCEKDYLQKKEAYESIYKKPLDYTFSSSDVAGWVPEDALDCTEADYSQCTEPLSDCLSVLEVA